MDIYKTKYPFSKRIKIKWWIASITIEPITEKKQR